MVKVNEDKASGNMPISGKAKQGRGAKKSKSYNNKAHNHQKNNNKMDNITVKSAEIMAKKGTLILLPVVWKCSLDEILFS